MKKFLLIIIVTLALIISVSTISFARNVSLQESLAEELKELGVFKGVSDTDFDLDRAPSRVEALVMLIRLLGVENEVSDGTWNHPFTDVPLWANDYVGYGYSKGLTNGISRTEFGTGDSNAAMYLTFVLRALGYSDANGADFLWSDPFSLAKQTGVLSDNVDINEFWRADVVVISHNAMSSYLKNSSKTLAQKLIDEDVFTFDEFTETYGKNKAAEHGRVLSPEEIYSNCSSSVFIIAYTGDGFMGTGSGFFINDKGVAITNYHVIDSATEGKIQTTDKSIYDILGVYAFNKGQDWAVIQIDCSGNDYLTIGDETTIVGGAPVYAIGSPKAYQNTISEGIISNPIREFADTDVKYIQITTPISHGSSGGALINKYGQVIGITSATAAVDAQNLNLAIPVSIVDISLSDEMLTLEQVKKKAAAANVQPPKPLKTEQAFRSLGGYVEGLYNTVLEDGRQAYFEIIGDSIETYIYYDRELDNVTVNTKYYDGDLKFDYHMSLDKNIEKNCFAELVVYELGTGVPELLCVGRAEIDKEKYTDNYNYNFYEFEGEGESLFEEFAKTFHYSSLNRINELFVKYSQEKSADVYSVYDLGYVRYK